jgi:hypothetical protein
MTELMDKNPFAWFWELVKASIGFFVIITTGDWFGLSSKIPVMFPIFIIYLAISMTASIWFSIRQPNLRSAS